eukprot:TRINITY_DN12292_c0_g1_i1.p2 TRINITY_DN12292_c0_g1~~TRINITY_DN12292_c0_g1_i1.p2  ORF type:complete len:142 (-),score=25.03 TRINITY_DN12292_c0_g1_i1:96-521(-)
MPPPKKPRQHRNKVQEEAPLPTAPSRPFAKKHFSATIKPLPIPKPPPREDADVMHSAEPHNVMPSYVTPGLRSELGLPMAPKLPEPLVHAVSESGYKRADQRVRKSVNKAEAREYSAAQMIAYPPLNSVHFEDQTLRRVHH